MTKHKQKPRTPHHAASLKHFLYNNDDVYEKVEFILNAQIKKSKRKRKKHFPHHDKENKWQHIT